MSVFFFFVFFWFFFFFFCLGFLPWWFSLAVTPRFPDSSAPRHELRLVVAAAPAMCLAFLPLPIPPGPPGC